MSLVNDMLRDLDRRNRNRSQSEQATRADVITQSVIASNRLPAVAIVLSVVVGVTSVYLLFNHSHEQPVVTSAPPATTAFIVTDTTASPVSVNPMSAPVTAVPPQAVQSSAASLPAAIAN